MYSGENPKSIYNTVPGDAKGGPYFGPLLLTKNYTREAEEPEDDELIGIKKGEFVNISDLLFTKSRDYLIKCNDGQQVKAKELAGKVVVIYFDSVLDMDTDFLAYLIHTYNNVRHNCGVEVVFVNVDDAVNKLSGEISLAPSQGGIEKYFEDIISCMPWTAIPLSDITSRKRIKGKFGIPVKLYIGTPVVVDSTGMILQTHAYTIILNNGALGYPFSDERIDFLDSEDYAAARQPSLKTLLASPERDYLISNKEDKVSFSQLDGKRVIIFFGKGQVYKHEARFLESLKDRYIELKGTDDEFEVIQITTELCSKTEHVANLPWFVQPRGKDYSLSK